MSSRACGVLALAALWLGACQPEDQACDQVMGVYEATYTYVNGNCAYTPGTAGAFDMTSDRPTSTMMQVRTDDMITTEVIKQGCTVSIARSATRQGATLWQVEGELDVESGDVLSGPTYRYEWLNGAPVCQGTYETIMRRQSAQMPDPMPIQGGSPTF